MNQEIRIETGGLLGSRNGVWARLSEEHRARLMAARFGDMQVLSEITGESYHALSQARAQVRKALKRAKEAA